MITLPVFQLDALVGLLAGFGYACRRGNLRSDIKPDLQPYLERWLQNRDGFVTMENGSVGYIGIEEVVRMGPFFNIYCIVENGSLADRDEDAHNLLDASPYYRLHNGRITDLGWSGGVLSGTLAKDTELSQELAKNIMKEEVKRLSVKAYDCCCVIATGVWDPEGLASIFGMVDRIAMHVRTLIKQVHFGENVGV